MNPIVKTKVALAVIALAVIGVAGVAVACTPKLEQFALDPPAASSGEPVTVSGTAAPMSEVTLRWNSLDGPVLATVDTTTADFSETIRVPDDAEPGVAYVIAEPEGNTDVARAAFEVTGGEQATTATQSAWDLSQDPTTADTVPSPAGLTAPVAAGVGLLTLGVVGLFAGATVATVQTRRAPARAPAANRRLG